jgi:hypothetical protein
MTYKILMDDTRRIIHHSNIRSAADPNARNLHLDPLNDEPPEVIWSLCKASPALDHGEDFSLHSINFTTIDDLRQILLDQYLRIGLESGDQVPLLLQTVEEGYPGKAADLSNCLTYLWTLLSPITTGDTKIQQG